ncbi:MAG: hypothetical protein H7X93_01160 [Sphingomonadaceae bacterium]|nr:hypothetical protein [Sphingomonadaceae bacterium]
MFHQSNLGDPRAWIAFTIIALFAYAYVSEAGDTLEGALIAAFNIAIGYYLGSSRARDGAAGPR